MTVGTANFLSTSIVVSSSGLGRPPSLYNHKKITIPFTPDNIIQMEKDGKEKSEIAIKEYKTAVEIHEKKLAENKKARIEKDRNSNKFNEFLNAKKINDNLIDENMSEIDALYKWKELNFIMPPPIGIKKIKESYNMPWSKFIKHIQDNF